MTSLTQLFRHGTTCSLLGQRFSQVGQTISSVFYTQNHVQGVLGLHEFHQLDFSKGSIFIWLARKYFTCTLKYSKYYLYSTNFLQYYYLPCTNFLQYHCCPMYITNKLILQLRSTRVEQMLHTVFNYIISLTLLQCLDSLNYPSLLNG